MVCFGEFHISVDARQILENLVVDVGGKDIFHVKMGERVLANGGVVNPSHNMLNDGRGNKPRLRYLRGADGNGNSALSPRQRWV